MSGAPVAAHENRGTEISNPLPSRGESMQTRFALVGFVPIASALLPGKASMDPETHHPKLNPIPPALAIALRMEA